MCANRPITNSAINLDFEPQRKPRLPLRLRIAGWILSRLELIHREWKGFYRTWYGFGLVWLNVGLWTLAAAARIGGAS